MAQALKLIDINRSYVPIDPRSFPESMHSTQAEDQPEGRIPVVPYDGYNFMPTAYGYMSYFGINSILGINALTLLESPFDLLNVDDLFIVQTPDLRNIMVALCEDGIYTKYAASSGAWTKDVDLTIPDSGVHYNYTKCVIGNEVYIYRAGASNIWVLRAAEDFVPTALNPSSNMNMAAQQGIFKAGGRLGMWDSANSIAWSDVDDKMDFMPSLETGAGATIFQQIVGKIVVCIQHGNGFIIYCTRAIVHVRRTADANFFWNSETIFNDNGISYLNEVAQGQPDTTHFAYTTFGFVQIKNGQSEYIIPEVFSYLKEKRDPVYLRVLEGRYLFLQFLNPDYLLGIPNFTFEGVPGSTITFEGGSYNITHTEENACKAIRSAEIQHEGIYLFNVFGYTSKAEATVPGQVPIWDDHLSGSITNTILKAWKTRGGSSFGNYLYFSDIPFAQGSVPKITGGNEFFIPDLTISIPFVAGFAEQMHVEPNTEDFYAKQEMIWEYERRFFSDWKTAILQKEHPVIESTGTVFYTTVIPTALETSVKYTFGPYLDLSFFSELNKYYGLEEKSAWLQRSLTKGVSVEITVNTVYDAIVEPTTDLNLTPEAKDLAIHPFINYSNNLSGGNFPPLSGPYFVGAINDQSTFYLYTVYEDAGHTIGLGVLTYTKPLAGSFSDGFSVSGSSTQQYKITPSVTQAFGQPVFKSVDYDKCINKELGYTQITGHGHYDLLGNFIQDDDIDEDPDYIDQCDIAEPPNKERTIYFNDVPVPPVIGCLPQDPTIDNEVYSWPDEVIVLPPSEFLMQDGSIEPIYPTFQGAFVYDLQYKKWGKCGQAHKLLLNYSPINSQAGDKPIPADIFSVNAGCLLEDNTIALFDKYPSDSRITWGKIGYFRKGFTDCEEVRLQFRNPATGTVIVEGSLDGKNIEPAIGQLRSFENVNEILAYFSNSARWFNLTVTGMFDIKNIDFNGHKKGKR